MRQDRLEMLKMLAEGKITAEEAEMLLRALDEAAAPNKKADIEDEQPKQEKDFVQEMTEMFQEVGREIEVEVSNAINSVQLPNVKKVVDDVVDQVKSSVAGAVDGAVDGAVAGAADSGSDITDTAEEGGGKRKVKQQLDVFKGTGITKIDAQAANGRITLQGSDRDEVSVRAWKDVRGRRGAAAEFAEKVEIYAEQIGDELRIFAEHPTPPWGVSLAVRYAIETPREVDVNLRTVNSKIKVTGTSGAIDVTTANGVITLEGDAGPIRARATNGTVKAEIDTLTDDAEFSTTNGTIGVEVHQCAGSVAALTTNGSIKLTLPADFAGQLDAEARRGRVHSDFPSPVIGKMKNQLKGEIGGGGEAVVKLRSQNGSIRLKRQEP